MYDLLQTSSGVNITINAGQLIEAINHCVAQTRKEFEKQMEPEQYVTRKAAAELLNVDLSTLWRWNEDGYLSPIKAGGKRLYRKSDIDKILNGGGA